MNHKNYPAAGDIRLNAFVARSLCVLAVILSFTVGTLPGTAFAQAGAAALLEEKDAPETDEFKPLIDQAKEQGLRVIILAPGDEKPAAVEDAGPTMTEQLLAVRSEVRRIVLNAPNAWAKSREALERASPDGTWWWLLIALATAAGGLLVASLVSRYVRLKTQKHFEHIYNPDPQSRLEKISYLMFRASMIALNCFIMLVSAILVALIFDQGHEPTRATILVIVVCWVAYWVFRAVILFNIIAHDLPKHRMINLNDEDAASMQYATRNSMVAVIIAFGVCAWMDLLGIDRDVHKLFLVVAMLIASIIFIYLTVRYADPIRGVVLGKGDPKTKPGWRRLLATITPPALIIYLVVAWMLSSVRTIMELPSAALLVAAPSIAFFSGLAIYGLILIIIDRIYLARQRRFEIRTELERERRQKQMEAEERARVEALSTDEDEDEQVIINQVMSEHKLEDMPAFRPIFKPLLESAAGVVVMIAAIGFILSVWEVNVGEQGNPVTAFLDTLLVIFMGWFAYKAVALYIDSTLEHEGPSEEVDHEGEGGQGATRVQTLLPLVRNVLIATIFVIMGMIVLSNLGVDIAPLFAGAGVIGLAVGFGAQTLIRDIFSGGFFLFDDAFRKGEYIELDGIRGTVEKISLRSFQLRHHNGPLHTVPFGEIKQLTNYSRDWVIMKLPLRVTYDTDVERVRKLVKKLGQQLLEHPDVGRTFLQPLKSQGVTKMEDSAMIIRVKFMTKPGDQWVTRKVVYAAIRELFEREGIRFAHKEVTVRLAEEPEHPLTDNQKRAVTAAARAAVDDDQAVLEPEDDTP